MCVHTIFSCVHMIFVQCDETNKQTDQQQKISKETGFRYHFRGDVQQGGVVSVIKRVNKLSSERDAFLWVQPTYQPVIEPYSTTN